MLVSAFFVYSLEHTIKQGEREIRLAQKQNREARETIRLLQAEWSMLTQPDRLQRLAGEYLKLRPTKAGQMVPRNMLAAKLPDRPAPDPTKIKDDPIAQMLKGLKR